MPLLAAAAFTRESEPSLLSPADVFDRWVCLKSSSGMYTEWSAQ
jgi:hypothetical protein